MYTEAFYTLTLGNRVFSDIFHPGLRLIHISIHSLETLSHAFTEERDLMGLTGFHFMVVYCLYY